MVHVNKKNKTKAKAQAHASLASNTSRNQATLASAPDQPPSIEVKELPGKGIGLVALRDLKAGDLILKESPILTVDYRKGGLATIESSYSRLSDQDRSLYDALYVAGPNQRRPKVEAIFQTNSIQLGPQSSITGLFLKGSRFNHSCRPNVTRHWDEEQSCEWFISNRNISKGTELCISYNEIRTSKEERQKRLKSTWGFECSCAACSMSEEDTFASDARRMRIKSLDDSTTSLQTSPRELIAHVQQIIRLLEEEDLVICRADAAFEAMSACIWFGDRVDAIGWIDRVLEYEKVEAGIWSSKFKMVEAWKGNPALHPAWSFKNRLLKIPTLTPTRPKRGGDLGGKHTLIL